MLKKRCYRRSQVSLFIILGILILVFVALYYATVIPAIENMKENSVKPYDNTVESFMEYCMDHKTDQIFSAIGQTGGMLYVDYIDTAIVSKDTLKTKEQIKQDIILLTNFMINECIEENPFSAEINYNNPKYKIEFYPDITEITITDAYVAYDRGRTIDPEISMFKNIRFARIYDIAAKNILVNDPWLNYAGNATAPGMTVEAGDM